MTADPYYVAAYDDPAGKIRALEATVAHLRAQLATITAERDALVVEQERMTTALCSAAVHECRGGRVGARSFWNAVFGGAVKAVRL